MDLGGGLNTRLDPHALARNELAVSVNLWDSYDSAVAKRPGSAALGTTSGALPSNLPTQSMTACRFNNQTYLLIMDTAKHLYQFPIGGSAYTLLGTLGASAKFHTSAQMFDPSTQTRNVFICDGVSVPKYWSGPPSTTLTTVTTGGNNLPNQYNQGVGHPITPQFVKTLGNNSHLFYSGEPTNTCAVYISDPFYPQNFTSAAMQVSADPSGGYNPAIIGMNDGVEGGDISGLETLGSVMIVFKYSATYIMVQTTLLGEIPAWQVVQVSNSIGCQAPLSIVRFDTFVVFLAVDGVYITDAQSVKQISGDVAPFFDSSLSGYPAIIQNRQTAIGVRHGARLLLFFESANATVNNTGLWFNFGRQTRGGNPVCGQIMGMNVGGAVTCRGPLDDGNVAWGDASISRIGYFGIAFNDFGQPIQTQFAGKADLFDDIFGPESVVAEKQIQDAYALIQVLNVVGNTQVDFYGFVTCDLDLAVPRSLKQPITIGQLGGFWGVGLWGAMTWGASNQQAFTVVKIPLQGNARGYLCQVGILENSTVPWIMIGYAVYVNPQKTGY